MPKPTKGPRLGGSPSHERIILANMASQLFEHGRITTTETRAKRVQPLAERLIAKAKRGDLHSRRVVRRTVTNPDVLHALFAEIAPKMAGRDGGYTRITKVGPRKGDNAPMAIIEIITDPVKKSEPKKSTKKAEPKAAVVEETPEKLVEAVEEAADDIQDTTGEAAEVQDVTGEAAEAAEETADEAKA